MAIKLREVEDVPVLNQSDFPELPQIPKDDCVFVGFESDFGSTVKEFAAGIIVTACIRGGKKWQAVSAIEFVTILQDTSYFTLFQQRVVDSIWAFYEEGLTDMVQVGDEQYLIPKPEMVKIALEAKQPRIVH